MATLNKEHTVTQTAALPLVSQGHGRWRKGKGNLYLIRSSYFRFGGDGHLIGTSETIAQMTVDGPAGHAEGTFTNRLYDLSGAEVGSFSGTATAERLPAPIVTQ